MRERESKVEDYRMSREGNFTAPMLENDISIQSSVNNRYKNFSKQAGTATGLNSGDSLIYENSSIKVGLPSISQKNSKMLNGSSI